MEKFSLSHIKVLSSGEQVKKKIIEKFGDIYSFAREINMETQTVHRYLKERKLGTKLFKTKLCEALITDLNELIKSDKEQIKNMVENIYNNIAIYKDYDDINILRKIQELCFKNNLKLEISKMNRNIGMYYFYNGITSRAIGIMKDAIGSVKNRDLLIKWKSELALMYIYQCDYKKSRKLHEEIDKLLGQIDKIDDKTMFLHYYRYGILENNKNNHFVAERLFLKSLEYAKRNIEIGNTLTNIGLSFKLRQNYKKAVGYYNEALEIFEDDLNKSRVYNNLAELYKLLGEYDKALNHIKLAFDHIDIGNISKYFTYYQTYAQIKILIGEHEGIVKKLYNVVMDIEDTFVHRQIVIEGIKTLIDYCIKTDKVNMLENMLEFVISLIERAPEKHERYLHELYGFVGKIRLYMMREKEA